MELVERLRAAAIWWEGRGGALTAALLEESADALEGNYGEDAIRSFLRRLKEMRQSEGCK